MKPFKPLLVKALGALALAAAIVMPTGANAAQVLGVVDFGPVPAETLVGPESIAIPPVEGASSSTITYAEITNGRFFQDPALPIPFLETAETPLVFNISFISENELPQVGVLDFGYEVNGIENTAQVILLANGAVAPSDEEVDRLIAKPHGQGEFFGPCFINSLAW